MDKKNGIWIGYLTAFLSLLCGASVYILSKSILRVLDISSFMFFWFGMASFNITLFILLSMGKGGISFKNLIKELRNNILFYSYILSSELGAALLFFF